MKVDKSKWETKVFGNICSVINGKSQKDVEDPHGRFPIYGSGGIMGYAKDYICEANTTIIGRKGTINAPILVKEPFWNIDTAFGLHPLNEELSPYYLYYFCVAFNFTSIQSGVTIPSLTKKDISKILVPVPPLSEQQAIASELDAIQSLITKYKEQLNDYDNLAKSIFNEMFGDVVSNDKGWEYQLFGNLFILKSGDGLSSKQQLGGEYPVYGGNGINGQHCKYNKDGEYIIIGRVGAYCGNVRLVKGRFWLTDNAFELVEIDSNQIKLFLKFLLTSLNLGKYAHKAAQPVISNLVLKNIPIPIPPLPLQQAFAARITAIESQKDKVKQQIADLQTLFDSRMQYYFD